MGEVKPVIFWRISFLKPTTTETEISITETDNITARIPSLIIIREKVLRDLNDIRLAMKNSRFKLYSSIVAVKVIFLVSFTFSYFNEKEINQTEKPIVLGIEVLLKQLDVLSNKRVAIVANQTSVIKNQHLVDTLLSRKIDVKRIFAPEHGFRGDHSAGSKVASQTDEKTGLELASLYGKNKKPRPEQLSDIDIILFDIQDVGARFYTYISTLHYVMEAAAESSKTVMVLDRPNPHGNYIDGPILDEKFQSFVGMHPIPVVHGMTIGEYAQMINGQGWLLNGVKCDLVIVGMENYNHQLPYELPIAPSPNLPNNASIQLYPSLCFFEGTPVSIGRGTPTPFQIIGHPEHSGDFVFTPVSIPGKSEYPKFQNKVCHGISLDKYYKKQQKMQELNLNWLLEFYQSYPDKDGFFTSFFDKLAGTDELRKQIVSGLSIDEIRASWKAGLEEYQTLQEKYRLYP